MVKLADMKILFTVEFYDPHKGGAEEVVKQLAERLAQKGHKVAVATSRLRERKISELHGVHIEEFELSGNLIRGINGSEEEKNRYREYVCSGFDIIFNYATQVWTTDLVLELVGTTPAKWILIPCGYSGLKIPAYKKYFEDLPRYLKQYTLLVYMSPNYQDKIFGDEHGVANKAVIIPNGASEEEFRASDTFHIREKLNIKTPYLLLCVSNHYRAKGHRFVIDAFLQLKRKDVTLLIVGEAFVSTGFRMFAHFVTDYLRCRYESLVHPRIHLVSGKDRALVLSAYKTANLFVFGSQVEVSPLVMYESFAARLPFITTLAGNVANHADFLKIVKTPSEMAATIEELLNNDAMRKQLSEKAYELWAQNYTWSSIVERYEKLFI